MTIEEALADGARGAQFWKSSSWTKHCRRATRAGRFAALRCSYTIVRNTRASAPRDEPHAGRASNGRSEAASASSDPCSKIGFYRRIRPRVDARIPLQRGFHTARRGNMFQPVSLKLLDRTVGRPRSRDVGHPVEARARAVGAIIVLSRLTKRTAPPAWLPTTT
jgi:hypothetical protein